MSDEKLHGVNLGGWLILEKWMTPSLFENSNAEDEYCLILESDKKDAEKLLQQHWQSFITKEDFIWIKKQNLNAVRIPVGYWVFEQDEFFISSLTYFEQALEWAKEVGLKVLIDLHAAPGSQNGTDHSGRIGEINWHKSPEHIERTLEILKIITQKYGAHPAVIGIEILNEPHWDVPLTTLKKFYKKAYELIRSNSNEELLIVMHDGFRPTKWKTFFQKNNFKNVLLDLHLYQCYSDYDRQLNLEGHLTKTRIEWQKLINKLQKYVPVIIGEWSRGLDPESLKDLEDQEIKAAKELYFETQLEVFEEAHGWFFWNYKIENEMMKSDWSYKNIKDENL